MKNINFLLFCGMLFFTPTLVSAGSFMVSGSPVHSLQTNASSGDIPFYKVEYAFDAFQDSIFPVVSFGGFDEGKTSVHLVAASTAFRTNGAGLYAQGNAGIGFISENGLNFSSNPRITLGAFIGWRSQNANIRIGLEHISGDSSASNIIILNNAENFLVLSMQTPLIIRW